MVLSKIKLRKIKFCGNKTKEIFRDFVDHFSAISSSQKKKGMAFTKISMQAQSSSSVSLNTTLSIVLGSVFKISFTLPSLMHLNSFIALLCVKWLRRNFELPRDILFFILANCIREYNILSIYLPRKVLLA